MMAQQPQLPACWIFVSYPSPLHGMRGGKASHTQFLLTSRQRDSFERIVPRKFDGKGAKSVIPRQRSFRMSCHFTYSAQDIKPTKELLVRGLEW